MYLNFLTHTDKLPAWLIFRNFTFVGFPVQQDNIKFVSIVINYNRHKTLRDVFLINGIDQYQPTTKLPSHNQDKNCEIKIDKSFDSVDDLWNLIVYLMPKNLNEIINDDGPIGLNYLKPNPNQAVNEWARDLFTVSSEEKDNKLVYNLLINNQACSRDLNDYDDLQYKLTKLGIQFSVIKNVYNFKDSTDDDDEDNQFFLNSDQRSMLNDQWSMPNKNRRQIGKRLPIYSTPVPYTGWQSILPTSTHTVTPGAINPINHLNNEYDNNLNTKDLIQPSLSTPDQLSSNTLLTTPTIDQQFTPGLELTTPHFNPASVLNNNIYTTPSFQPQPPTDYLTTSDLITPTPTITFIVSDTAKELSFSTNLESISPSITSSPDSISTSILGEPIDKFTTFNPIVVPDSSSSTTSNPLLLNTTLHNVITTTTFKSTTSSTTTTTTTTTQKPIPRKPKINTNSNLPDHPPVLGRERIPKLRLTSGVYWYD